MYIIKINQYTPDTIYKKHVLSRIAQFKCSNVLTKELQLLTIIVT